VQLGSIKVLEPALQIAVVKPGLEKLIRDMLESILEGLNLIYPL
jgi:hypothetical protein